jgi:hypothetical protein
VIMITSTSKKVSDVGDARMIIFGTNKEQTESVVHHALKDMMSERQRFFSNVQYRFRPVVLNVLSTAVDIFIPCNCSCNK